MATNYIRDRELRRIQWCVTQELRKQPVTSDAVARYLAAKAAA